MLRCVRLFATRWTAACQASLSITNSQSLPKCMSIELVMPSNHLILCHPLLLLPSIFPSIRVFSNESVLCIRWPKCWSFSFSISPSNEYSGLINRLVGSPCSPRDSQESSTTPQFRSIRSLALSFLLGDFPSRSDGKASAYNVGGPASIPGSGRSPGEGNGNPLQYLAWKIPWMRSLLGYSPRGCKELDTTE